MSNWNTGESFNITKSPQAFTWVDVRSIETAIKGTAWHHLGLFAEPFTMPQLADLFCPHQYLSALRTVYDIEEPGRACGEIVIDCAGLMTDNIFEADGDPYCKCASAVLRICFDRASNPGGFVTPTPIFGSRTKPLGTAFLGLLRSDAYEIFVEEVRQLIRLMGRWSMVLWTFNQLQTSVRSPHQMRYVWPAIYTLATQAKLPMAPSLANASARAGMNANPDARCKPFLRPTYEVVANSVLLEPDKAMIKRWNEGQVSLISCNFTIFPTQGSSIGVQGI